MMVDYRPLTIMAGNAREAVRRRVSSRPTYHSHAVVN
jgi:hypothetical protein